MSDQDYETIRDGFDIYQAFASKTAIYPAHHKCTYPLLGLMGEVGEFCNKYKKELRDGTEMSLQNIKDELGDILWYLAAVASDFDMSLGVVATRNIEKLRDRQNRGVLGGSGDER